MTCGGASSDGGVTIDAIDAPDAPPGQFCSTWGGICVPDQMYGDLTLDQMDIDTGNDAMCTYVVTPPAGPTACVLVGNNVTLHNALYFRAHGTRPIVVM